MAALSHAQETPQIGWKRGPAVVPLGSEAHVSIAAPLIFVDRAEASRFLIATGNPPTQRELAVVAAPALDWFAVFSFRSYADLGFSLRRPSAEEIARSIIAGSAAANRERAQSGRETLDVIGWAERPRVDPESGRLEWSLHSQESGGRNVSNRFVYFAARSGVLEVELVTEEENAPAARGEFEMLLRGVRVTRRGAPAWWWSLGAFGVAALFAWLFWLRRREGRPQNTAALG